MKLVAVTTRVSPADSRTALDALDALRETAIGLEGCLDYRISVSPDEPGAIFVWSSWNDAQAFEAYRASEGFARMGRKVRPLMIGTPETVAYDAVPAA